MVSTSRWGSVLLAQVKPSWLGRVIGGDAFERSQKTVGGVWVGARIVIADGRVTLRPVWWDRLLHRGLPEISVPLSDVTTVRWTKQGVVGTVFLAHARGELIFRCYRVPGVLALIDGHRRVA